MSIPSDIDLFMGGITQHSVQNQQNAYIHSQSARTQFQNKRGVDIADINQDRKDYIEDINRLNQNDTNRREYAGGTSGNPGGGRESAGNPGGGNDPEEDPGDDDEGNPGGNRKGYP